MKYALITGATSGLGRDFARLTAYIGYNLILIGRREDRLLYLQSFLSNRYNIDVIIIKADLSDMNDVKMMCNKVISHDLSLVINCAGVGELGSFDSYDLDRENDLININVNSLTYITSYFARRMSSGYIMNVSSVAAFNPDPLMSTYGASKSYVLNYTLAASFELKMRRSDVHICALCPGPLSTEFNANAGAKSNINMTSSFECAKYALNKMYERQTIILPTKGVKVAKVLSKIVPDSILTTTQYYIQKRKSS